MSCYAFFMGKFCETMEELAIKCGINYDMLISCLKNRIFDTDYDTFVINKKNGGKRLIESPSDYIRLIQKKLIEAIRVYLEGIEKNRSLCSYAFEKRKSIILNAKMHTNRRYVLHIDIKDYFMTIHFGRVMGLFEKDNRFLLKRDIAMAIANIVCHSGYLPQGAPSSPFISNLFGGIIDARMVQIAKKYRLTYTRYADDLIFSTNMKDFIEKKDEIVSLISGELKNAGFNVNKDKTIISYKDNRQMVTGLVVNQIVNYRKEYYKNTRSMVHSLYKTEKFFIDGKEGTIRQLEGRLSFLMSVADNKVISENEDNKNKEKDRKCRGLKFLCSKFLFYKYFIDIKKPIIFTEGKTDIIYLKYAIKRNAEKFSNLYDKKNNKFKVHFMKYSKIFEKVFDYSTGGTGMLVFYNKFFKQEKSLYHYITKIYRKISIQPIIFIVDNEENNTKPLKMFIRENKYINKDLTFLKEKWYCALRFDDKNIPIYLMTYPKNDKSIDKSVEDLMFVKKDFPTINGKKFSKKDGITINDEKFYTKTTLANYVSRNYNYMNFDGFLPFLSELNKLLDECI